MKDIVVPCPHCGGKAIDSDADGIAYCTTEHRIVHIGGLTSKIAALYPHRGSQR